MSPALPREERDAIRARAEAAMTGPWHRGGQGGGSIILSPEVYVAQASGLKWAANAEFIAHARSDVPALLDALDAAEAEVAALRGRIEALADEWERTTTQSLAASDYTYSLPMRDVLTRLRRALAADEGERTGR